MYNNNARVYSKFLLNLLAIVNVTIIIIRCVKYKHK